MPARPGSRPSSRSAATVVELSPGADAAAYRLIQEALTNVYKHAGTASTSVTLDYAPQSLEIEIANEDDGYRLADGPVDSGGQGLVGMRERMGLYGGEVEAVAAARRRISGQCAAATRRPRQGKATRMSIRVLLVDDQALIRAGFRMILESEEDIEVVGECANGAQAIDWPSGSSPTSS